MFLLLVSAGAIYLLLGDINDALMLLGFVCIVMGITIYQEYKTERVLDALRDLTSPRALTFSTIVIGNLGLILVNRSWQHTLLTTLRSSNRALWWVLGGAFAFLILALTLPFMRTVFHFAPVTPSQFTLCAMMGIVSVLWFEWFKIIQRK